MHFPLPPGRVGPQCADQRSLRSTRLVADEVEAPVDAVGAVDVRVAGGPEHRRVAGGATAESVTGGILLVVCLDLDDHAAVAAHEQRDADQVGCDLVHGTGEEVTQQLLHERRSRSGTQKSCSASPVFVAHSTSRCGVHSA